MLCVNIKVFLSCRIILLKFVRFHLGFVRYELAEECADDDDAKAAISQLRKDVLEELKMHDSFVQVRH